MKNLLKIGLVVFCAVRAGDLQADVWDLTDPTHPVSLSSAPMPGEEQAQYFPSFECKKAKSKTEHLICDDEKLATAERQLAITYRSLRACLSAEQMTSLRKEQRRWLMQRESCGTPFNSTADIRSEQAIACLQAAFNTM